MSREPCFHEAHAAQPRARDGGVTEASDLKSDTGRLKVRDSVRRTAARLDAEGVLTGRLDAELIVAHVLGVSRAELAVEQQRSLTQAEQERVADLAARRAGREPLQYVLGEWGFRRLTLTVDRRALIPRPEKFYFAFGKPISPTAFFGKENDKEQVWQLRKQVMEALEEEMEKLRQVRAKDKDVSLLRRLLTRHG